MHATFQLCPVNKGLSTKGSNFLFPILLLLLMCMTRTISGAAPTLQEKNVPCNLLSTTFDLDSPTKMIINSCKDPQLQQQLRVQIHNQVAVEIVIQKSQFGEILLSPGRPSNSRSINNLNITVHGSNITGIFFKPGTDLANSSVHLENVQTIKNDPCPYASAFSDSSAFIDANVLNDTAFIAFSNASLINTKITMNRSNFEFMMDPSDPKSSANPNPFDTKATFFYCNDCRFEEKSTIIVEGTTGHVWSTIGSVAFFSFFNKTIFNDDTVVEVRSSKLRMETKDSNGTVPATVQYVQFLDAAGTPSILTTESEIISTAFGAQLAKLVHIYSCKFFPQRGENNKDALAQIVFLDTSIVVSMFEGKNLYGAHVFDIEYSTLRHFHLLVNGSAEGAIISSANGNKQTTAWRLDSGRAVAARFYHVYDSVIESSTLAINSPQAFVVNFNKSGADVAKQALFFSASASLSSPQHSSLPEVEDIARIRSTTVSVGGHATVFIGSRQTSATTFMQMSNNIDFSDNVVVVDNVKVELLSAGTTQIIVVRAIGHHYDTFGNENTLRRYNTWRFAESWLSSSGTTESSFLVAFKEATFDYALADSTVEVYSTHVTLANWNGPQAFFYTSCQTPNVTLNFDGASVYGRNYGSATHFIRVDTVNASLRILLSNTQFDIQARQSMTFLLVYSSQANGNYTLLVSRRSTIKLLSADQYCFGVWPYHANANEFYGTLAVHIEDSSTLVLKARSVVAAWYSPNLQVRHHAPITFVVEANSTCEASGGSQAMMLYFGSLVVQSTFTFRVSASVLVLNGTATFPTSDPSYILLLSSSRHPVVMILNNSEVQLTGSNTSMFYLHNTRASNVQIVDSQVVHQHGSLQLKPSLHTTFFFNTASGLVVNFQNVSIATVPSANILRLESIVDLSLGTRSSVSFSNVTIRLACPQHLSDAARLITLGEAADLNINIDQLIVLPSGSELDACKLSLSKFTGFETWSSRSLSVLNQNVAVDVFNAQFSVKAIAVVLAVWQIKESTVAYTFKNVDMQVISSTLKCFQNEAIMNQQWDLLIENITVRSPTAFNSVAFVSYPSLSTIDGHILSTAVRDSYVVVRGVSMDIEVSAFNFFLLSEKRNQVNSSYWLGDIALIVLSSASDSVANLSTLTLSSTTIHLSNVSMSSRGTAAERVFLSATHLSSRGYSRIEMNQIFVAHVDSVVAHFGRLNYCTLAEQSKLVSSEIFWNATAVFQTSLFAFNMLQLDHADGLQLDNVVSRASSAQILFVSVFKLNCTDTANPASFTNFNVGLVCSRSNGVLSAFSVKESINFAFSLANWSSHQQSTTTGSPVFFSLANNGDERDQTTDNGTETTSLVEAKNISFLSSMRGVATVPMFLRVENGTAPINLNFEKVVVATHFTFSEETDRNISPSEPTALISIAPSRSAPRTFMSLEDLKFSVHYQYTVNVVLATNELMNCRLQIANVTGNFVPVGSSQNVSRAVGLLSFESNSHSPVTIKNVKASIESVFLHVSPLLKRKSSVDSSASCFFAPISLIFVESAKVFNTSFALKWVSVNATAPLKSCGHQMRRSLIDATDITPLPHSTQTDFFISCDSVHHLPSTGQCGVANISSVGVAASFTNFRGEVDCSDDASLLAISPRPPMRPHAVSSDASNVSLVKSNLSAVFSSALSILQLPAGLPTAPLVLLSNVQLDFRCLNNSCPDIHLLTVTCKNYVCASSIPLGRLALDTVHITNSNGGVKPVSALGQLEQPLRLLTTLNCSWINGRRISTATFTTGVLVPSHDAELAARLNFRSTHDQDTLLCPISSSTSLTLSNSVIATDSDSFTGTTTGTSTAVISNTGTNSHLETSSGSLAKTTTNSLSLLPTESLSQTHSSSTSASRFCVVDFVFAAKVVGYEGNEVPTASFVRKMSGVVQVNVSLHQKEGEPKQATLFTTQWNLALKHKILATIDNEGWGRVIDIIPVSPTMFTLHATYPDSLHRVEHISVYESHTMQFKIPLLGSPKGFFSCNPDLMVGASQPAIQASRLITVKLVGAEKPIPVSTRRTVEAIAMTSTLISGVLTNPTSGMIQARASALMSVSLCHFSHTEELDFQDSPFGWTVGIADGGYYRGALVGNAFLLLICIAIAMFLTWILWDPRKNDRTVWKAMGILHLPGVLIVPISQLIQGSAMVATALLAHGPSFFDPGLGIGTYVVLTIIIGLCVYRTTKGFHAVVVHRPLETDIDGAQRSLFGKLVGYAFLSEEKWIDNPADPELSAGFKMHWQQIFYDYKKRFPWYLGVELFVSVIIGILNGVMQESLCSEIANAFLVLIGLQWLCAVVLRPFIAPFETFFHVLLSTCTFLSAMLLVIGEMQKSEQAQRASNLIALLAVVFSSFKTVVDCLYLFRWFYSYYRGHRKRKAEKQAACGFLSEESSGENGSEVVESRVLDFMIEKISCFFETELHRTHTSVLTNEKQVAESSAVLVVELEEKEEETGQLTVSSVEVEQEVVEEREAPVPRAKKKKRKQHRTSVFGTQQLTPSEKLVQMQALEQVVAFLSAQNERLSHDLEL